MELKKTSIRFDKRHIRLRTGEAQMENGTYVFRWTGREGKRHAVYAPTLEMLRTKEEQVTVDKHDGIKTDTNSLTINKLFDLWKSIKTGVKDSTFQNYIYMYEMFVKPFFGRNKISTLHKSDVKAFYKRLVTDGLQVNTIDNIHNVLHQVLQVAVDDNLIRTNPADKVFKEIKKAYGHTIEKREALTRDQQELFFSYLLKTPKYLHWYPIFYIMANTGMRVGEITGLRWIDLDLEEKLIEVNHTLVYYNHRDERGCYFSINTPKTEAGERIIPMTDKVFDAFIMEKMNQKEADLISKSRIDGYANFVFINRFGEVMTQSVLNKALKRIVRDCNLETLEHCGEGSDPVLLPPFSCHVLRHTFATRLCESGINIKVIQSVLGHADIQTTMNLYVTVTESLAKKEMADFSNYLESITAPNSSQG